MLTVVTAGSTVAEPDTDAQPVANVTLTSVVDGGGEWSLPDIYAGYADDEAGSTEQPVADGTSAGVEDRVEWSLPDIYAGYADADAVPADGVR
jgi:hypothetical protein